MEGKGPSAEIAKGRGEKELKAIIYSTLSGYREAFGRELPGFAIKEFVARLYTEKVDAFLKARLSHLPIGDVGALLTLLWELPDEIVAESPPSPPEEKPEVKKRGRPKKV